ncbi:MAG: Gfo/Idh/MocA family oxidoreductase [Verrucomicrobiota bacterium]
MNASSSLAPAMGAPRNSGCARPRLGFLGVGWIGRNRLEAIARSGVAEIAAVTDSISSVAMEVARNLPGANAPASFEALLHEPLDGLVIATPSALHAEQSMAALERGLAVFCQKPLGRTGTETRQVIEVARRANRLLGVDLSYRHMKGVAPLRELIRSGQLGSIFAADLEFHNAYGPDKPWFYDRKFSGGGCVIDLGIHLIDLALWLLDFPRVTRVTSRLFAQGNPLRTGERVEDFAVAILELQTGAVLEVRCSWKLHAGCDARIGAQFFGSKGGAGFRNVNGSFYDFVTERFCGTHSQILSEPPDAWGGRAAVAWARRLAEDRGFDPEIEALIPVAETLDRIYSSAFEFCS